MNVWQDFARYKQHKNLRKMVEAILVIDKTRENTLRYFRHAYRRSIDEEDMRMVFWTCMVMVGLALLWIHASKIFKLV